MSQKALAEQKNGIEPQISRKMSDDELGRSNNESVQTDLVHPPEVVSASK